MTSERGIIVNNSNLIGLFGETICFAFMIFFSIISAPVAIASENQPLPIKVGTVVKDCAECPEMVAVPQLGRTADAPGKIFYAGRYEITWRQYLGAVAAKACPLLTLGRSERELWPPLGAYPPITDDYPLTHISRLQFQCYLDWLHKKTGFNYRIPSAAEWEHVARAGTTTKYPWGDTLGYNNAIIKQFGGSERKLFFDEDALIKRFGEVSFEDPRYVHPQDLWPVGSLKPNAWGLYDVIGNVEEITSERAPVCMFDLALFRRVRSGPCVTLKTRGQWLPEPKDQPPGFTLMTHRNAVEQSLPSISAGFRIFRD